jgi:hypothetical protein
MNLYIAGSSQELEVAKHWITEAIVAGFTITHDWVADIEKEGGTNPSSLTDGQRQEYALKDFHAVRDAAIVWCLGSEHKSPGMHVELGAALAGNLPTHVMFSGKRQSIFAWLVDEYHETHEQAFEALKAKLR